MTDGDDHVGGGQFVAAVGGDDHRASSTACGATSISSACSAWTALAATRSTGGSNERSLAAAASIVRLVTPSGSVVVTEIWPNGPVGHQRLEPLDRGESPVLLAPGGHGVIGQLPRRGSGAGVR